MDDFELRHADDSSCETCAERGRPNQPIYKMGMCSFCYRGVPHPQASAKELAQERMGAAINRTRVCSNGAPE